MYAKEIVTNPLLVEFWEKAISKGTHIEPPSKYHPNLWERDLGIALEYVFTGIPLRQIGEEWGVSHEYVRKLARKTTLMIWAKSSDNLKRRFQKHTLMKVLGRGPKI